MKPKRNKKKLIKRLAIALAVGLIVFAGSNVGKLLPKPKSYALTILAMSSQGPVPIAQVVARNISHNPDGSVCFVRVSDGKSGCLKFEEYDLSEITE